MNKVRVGLIGLGNMGRNHLRVLSMLNSVELAYVYDVDSVAMAKCGVQFGVKAAPKLDEMLTNIDAVVIASPTSTHYEYIKTCSDYIKNIFVEKPMASTVEDCQKIHDLSVEKKINLQVGFIERFNPAIISVKNLIETCKDKVLNVDFTRTNKVSSRITDVDVITDLMIHDIDLAMFFNGSVKNVQAYGIRQEGFIAFARAVLKHANGAFSNITASRITEKRIRNVSVMTNDSYIDCNLLSKEVFINKQSVEQYYTNASIISREETIDVKPQEALLTELLAFIEYCKSEVSLGIPDVLAGLASMEVAQTIQRIIEGDQ